MPYDQFIQNTEAYLRLLAWALQLADHTIVSDLLVDLASILRSMRLIHL